MIQAIEMIVRYRRQSAAGARQSCGSSAHLPVPLSWPGHRGHRPARPTGNDGLRRRRAADLEVGGPFAADLHNRRGGTHHAGEVHQRPLRCHRNRILNATGRWHTTSYDADSASAKELQCRPASVLGDRAKRREWAARSPLGCRARRDMP